MDLFLKKMKEETSECSLDAQDIQRCPFLSNISKPTSLCFSLNLPNPFPGARGPIFEEGPNFDMAFKHFHGKNGVVPLGSRSNHCNDDLLESDSAPKFNPLAANAATMSLSAFGPGGPFSFSSFSGGWKKNQKKKAEPSNKKDTSPRARSHEAMGNEWLQTGNCPIAKSYRAVSGVLPLFAKALQPPPGIKVKCPPAIVAARAALAKTALAKNLRPQPLPAKMLAIASLGMAVNVPLGVWREHTEKFSPSWFVAVHAAVPFIAMLRKAILMPKTAMALTIGASILGQALGARAERVRMKGALGKKQKAVVVVEATTNDLLKHGNDCYSVDNSYVPIEETGAGEKQVVAVVEGTRNNVVKHDVGGSMTSQVKAVGDRQVASLVERICNDLVKNENCGQVDNVASQCAKEQVTWYHTHSLKDDGSSSSRTSICF